MSNQPDVPSTQEGDNLTSQSNRWSLTTKYIVGVGLFISIMFFIILSRGSISMVIFAGLIAFVVRPRIGWFQRRLKWKRGTATGVTYLLVIVLLIIIPLPLIPPIIDAINSLMNVNYQAMAQYLIAWLDTAAAQIQSVPILGALFGPFFQSLALALEDFATKSTTTAVEPVTHASFTSQLARMTGILVNVLGPLISAGVSFLFMLLISLHMSLSVESL
jgi:predicted PurR-regulated permease PerM